MTKPNPEALVSLETAKAETEVSVSTLRRWIHDGRLPAQARRKQPPAPSEERRPSGSFPCRPVVPLAVRQERSK